eukprot:m.55715 g.55715  ORF g.55715 m.55715 type:complete len:717 (-) comp11000_c0_seq1:108-2258(-)
MSDDKTAEGADAPAKEDYLYVGVDLGNNTYTVATRFNKDMADILLNGLSNRETPTLVAFEGSQRWLGEPALSRATSNATNTIDDIMGLIGKSKSVYCGARSKHGRFTIGDGDDGLVKAKVSYRITGDDADSQEFSGTQLLGMLFADMKKTVSAKTKKSEKDNKLTTKLTIAVPPHFTAEQVKAVQTSAVIGGWDAAQLGTITSDKAAATVWANKHHSDNEEGDNESVLMLIDVGSSSSSASVLEFTGINEETKEPKINVLGTSATEEISVSQIDSLLFEFVSKLLKEKHGVTVTTGTRQGARLLRECGKVRKILSANENAVVVLECFGEEEKDYQFEVLRSQLEEACASLQESFKGLLTQALEKSGKTKDDVKVVEMIGGGTRVQFIRQTVTDLVGDAKITQTLDSSSSIALGAASLDVTAQDMEKIVSESAPLRDLEAKMGEQDAVLVQVGAEKNALETFIYETRSQGGDRKDLFDEEKTFPLLQEAEDWLFSDEGDALCEPGPAATKLKELEEKVKSLNPKFFEEIEAERLAKEKALEEERKKAEAEAGPAEDHDNRKLRKADRMKLMVKNKDEGAELFKGGNFKHAITRYVKALVHSNKFLEDLTDDDKKEVDTLKNAIHLNLAQCYIKLNEWKKAKASCDSALEITDSIKGLYRRAQAYYQMRDFDESLADCKKANKIEPQNKSVAKLMQQVQAQVTAQKEKEKKMYGKMFG